MSIIKILPENLVNQIAAGEVIERPASAVKELIENSLDAGATEICVELKDGGKTFIKVSDNGCGISKEDLGISVLRHATSKISVEADLWKIATMGFRGEALSSIAGISKFVIRSRKEGENVGNMLELEGGENRILKEVGMSVGTAVEVYDLFFNTPARRKYLKSEATELGHITAAVSSIALAHPEVNFKLIHNEKIINDLPKVTELLARISDIFGKSTSEMMLPIFYGGSEFQIDGYIAKPVLSRSSSQHQYFFVNGRAITDHLLANRVKVAYHSMLMEHKKPIFVINIKIDPALIDVNVHPRKLEIRFEDQQGMIKAIYGCVKSALEKQSLMPKGGSETQRYMSDGKIGQSFEKDFVGGSFGRVAGRGRLGSEAADAIRFTEKFSQKSIFSERENRDLEPGNDFAIKPVMQIMNSYIVAESEGGITLIDQHAAHERVRFETLMAQFEKENKEIQPLLMPFSLELTSNEVLLLQENMQIFEGLGFEIEHFGGQSFVIQSVPSVLASQDLHDVIKGVLDDLLEGKMATKMQGKMEEILTYMSCRSAIKFGQKLSIMEMESLVLQLQKCTHPYTCPHGRPTMVKLTVDEMARMFGRK
ncbi:DNA mismatch repair endonuclease MutL [Candidatus Peregrinibacteria bacterium]|nr:DNA mismatch repair endonuclease MutL [Candidatus Peregrinibacteria bacterium]